MTIRKHIFQTALGLAVISGFSACDALDDTCPLMNDNSASGDSLHIRLTIDTRGQNTRADNDRPNGGEKGDGWEFGTDDENRIHDVCIFAYQVDMPTPMHRQTRQEPKLGILSIKVMTRPSSQPISPSTKARK